MCNNYCWGSVATKLATPMGLRAFIMSQPWIHGVSTCMPRPHACSPVSVYSDFQVRFEWVYCVGLFVTTDLKTIIIQFDRLSPSIGV